MEKYKDFINASIKANEEIYKIVSSPMKDAFFKKELGIGVGGDISIGIDHVAEDIFVKYLQKFGSIDSEESGFIGEDKRVSIIIDPIDGSENFKSNIPYFGTSVALEENSQVKVGIVTNLSSGIIYIKCGSFFKKRYINCSKFYDIEIDKNANVGFFERSYSSKIYLDRLKNSGYKYRSMGAMALSMISANWVQFFIHEGVMRKYDVKAAQYMCEGLYQHKEKNLTIICNNLNNFNRLKELLLIG